MIEPRLFHNEEPFYAGQTRILEMVASGASLSDTLTCIVQLLEAHAGGMVCSILQLSADGKNMEHGAALSLPPEYVGAVNGAPIGPRNGSCGTAMFLRKPVVVTDVMSDPLWADYRGLAEICGFRSCWSTPIFSTQGDILGSFAMYGKEPREPNEHEKHLIQVATHITGIAIGRKRAEEALQHAEARLSLAAESGAVAFWSFYPAQNTAWMNEQGRRFYGFDPDQALTGELLLSRVHPEDRAAVKGILDTACDFPGPFESEHRLMSPSGDVRSVLMRGRCVNDESGELLEITGVTIDVSAQKQSELQLQLQRDELAHRNRVALVGEMTASLGHELNQPLTALANNAAAGLRFLDRGKLSHETTREILQDMIADSRRAQEVIRGIRALARKDKSGRTALNLNALIADTLRLVGPDAALRDCAIRTELAADLPQIEAVPIQMQQVLLNLIINALDALESVPSSQRRILISTQANNGDAVVHVRDFGTGLPRESVDKIFDHFFSTKESGMGMGLAIVRSIVEAHGGTVQGENASDGGAHFFFRLPAVANRHNSNVTVGPENVSNECAASTRRHIPSRPAPISL